MARRQSAGRAWKGVEPQALRRRLCGPDLARGVWGQGRAVQPRGDPPRGVRPRRGADARGCDRPRNGRAHDPGARHRGAEAALPAEDPLGRRDLVPGLLGAGRGLGSLRRPDARRGAGRTFRRRRAEGVVVVGAHRRLLHPRRSRRPGVAGARRAHVRDRRHARPGGRGAATAPAHRRVRVQRDLLRRRRGSAREPARRDRRRLAGGHDDAPARAGDARVRAHGGARGAAVEARRAREGARRGRSADPRPRRLGVDRAPGAQVHELPGADDADEDRHSGPRGLRRQAAVVRGEPARDEARAGDPRRGGRRLLAPPAASEPREHDRGRHQRDSSEHRGRARPRAPPEPLMQFALTEDQELLRREARSVLANGGWSRDEVAELDFLDRAVLFEEAGRANRGEEFLDPDGPEHEQLAALALEAVGIAQHVLELAIEHARTREQFGRPIGVYQAVSHPLADTYIETELARSLAYWAAWCVAEGDGQAPVAVAAAKSYAGDAAVAACERSIQVHGGIGFTWEHVLHRYYKRALWIQAFGGYGREHRARVAAFLLD